MTKKKTKSNPQRNYVAKNAYQFNQSNIQPSAADKIKHGKTKHKIELVTLDI